MTEMAGEEVIEILQGEVMKMTIHEIGLTESVDLREITTGTVDLREITTGTVDLREITTGTVDLREITTGTVDLREITIGNVDLREITIGNVVVTLIDQEIRVVGAVGMIVSEIRVGMVVMRRGEEEG